MDFSTDDGSYHLDPVYMDLADFDPLYTVNSKGWNFDLIPTSFLANLLQLANLLLELLLFVLICIISVCLSVCLCYVC